MSITAERAAAALARLSGGRRFKAILYQTEKPTWYLVVHSSIVQPTDLNRELLRL